MRHFKSVLVLGLVMIFAAAIAPACVEEQCIADCSYPLELELALPEGAVATSVEGSVTLGGVEHRFHCGAAPQAFSSPVAPTPTEEDMVVPLCDLVDGTLFLGGLMWESEEQLSITLSANGGRYGFEGVVHPTHHEVEILEGGCGTCPKSKGSVALHQTGLEDSQ